MTPEEQAIALQEAKARGLPDGWRVELDVSSDDVFKYIFCRRCCSLFLISHNTYCYYF